MADDDTTLSVQMLLVEDDRESGASLKLMLERRGMAVTWTQTAEAALELWRVGGFDVVVSDIRLGGMSGVDLLGDIRRAAPAFPFILLTGFDSLDTAIRAVRLGAQDYILKPLDDIDALIRPVRKAVDHHRLLVHARSVEGALRESERRLSTLMSNLAGMAYRCLMDRRWTMEFVSDGCRELLGCEPSDLLGNRRLAYADVIHPEDRASVEKTVREAVDRALPFQMEYRVNTLEGQLKWVWEKGRAVPDASGGVRLEGFIEDVTERRRAEDTVRQLNAELEQRVRERTAELEAANKELEAFSCSVSHDLRAPIRTFMGYCQTTLEDHGDVLGEDGRGDLNKALVAARRMATLVDALLKLSRLAKQPVAKERVDLSCLVRDELLLLAENEPARHVETDVEEGLFTDGDPGLLRAVLENLLGNAWKFTRLAPQPHIEVGRDAAGTFFVRDNGAGFDMNYADKLFQPFQRLHSDGDFEGTGIGLATVFRIIQRHGGRIWAEAQVGRGATFYFAL